MITGNDASYACTGDRVASCLARPIAARGQIVRAQLRPAYGVHLPAAVG